MSIGAELWLYIFLKHTIQKNSEVIGGGVERRNLP